MKWVPLFGMPGLVFAAYAVAPAKFFPEPDLARVVFFHLPSAFTATLFAIFGAIASWRYLATRQWIWEHRALAATEIAAVMSVVTMLTGVYFSRVQWGAWWHWDPRQTSFLVVLLLLGAYFALRMAFDDDVLKARVAAAYSTLTLLPLLFLIFVFPRLPQVAKVSLHPQNTVVSRDGFTPDYWFVVVGVFAMLMLTCVWLLRMHVRASVLEHKLREANGRLEVARNGATTDTVVRPVVVRTPGGGPD